jgi:ribosome-binding factor A
VLQILNRNTGHLQKILNRTLLMKIIPKIEFWEEKKVRGAARVEEILEEIKKKKEKLK